MNWNLMVKSYNFEITYHSLSVPQLCLTFFNSNQNQCKKHQNFWYFKKHFQMSVAIDVSFRWQLLAKVYKSRTQWTREAICEWLYGKPSECQTRVNSSFPLLNLRHSLCQTGVYWLSRYTDNRSNRFPLDLIHKSLAYLTQALSQT